MKQPNNKVTLAQAIRDVLITAMNRGQLPLLFILACCFLVLCRLPVEQLSSLVFEIIQGLKDGYLIGYGLFIITVILWYWDGRKVRKKYSALSNQYQKLQQKSQKQTKPKK